MIFPAQQTVLSLLWCLVLVRASSLSVEDVRSGLYHSMKKWKNRDGFMSRKGQKEVVENYEVGNNGHLLQQLIPLKAFLSEKLKEYESHKDKDSMWVDRVVKAKSSVPNNLIKHRRKREIGEILHPNSLRMKTLSITKNSTNATEHKIKKREKHYQNDSEKVLELDEMAKEDRGEDIPDELVNDTPLFKDKEDYDNFFRNEYYRTLAQSFATSRKKRESDDSSSEFYELTGRLDNIEDALLSDVVDSIEGNRGNRNTIETIEIANDVENVRAALSHLKEMLDKIDENDLDRNEGHAKKVGSFPTIFRTHSSDQNAKTWEDATNDVAHVQPQNAGFRPLPGFSARPIPDGDLPLGKWKFFDEDKKGQECPTLFLLTRDCSSLGDIIPEAKLRRVLTRACNWLEICYACGQGYELQPDDCDTGFLYGMRSVCEGDVPCQATGRLLLLSLRQKGASRRSLQPMCHADRCVEHFLRQPSP